MKSIIFFLLLSVLIGCGRCDHCDEQPIEYEYSIQNSSGAKVEIIPYILNSAGVEEINLSEKITIENSENYTEKFKDLPPYNGFSYYNLLNYPKKIDIVFNNSRKITYQICDFNGTPCIDPKNIFSNDYNNGTLETYIITANDFQNALDCNGNCF